MASSFDEQLDTASFTTIAKLAEDVVYRVPGCSDVMVRKMLQSVYGDFCRRSCCLLTTRRLSLEDGVCNYPIFPVYGQTVGSVTRIVRDCDDAQIRPMRQGRDYRVIDGAVVKVHFMPHVLPTKGQKAFVEVHAVEIPALDSERIPAWFANKHGAAIVSGTLANLLGMANRPWSDPQASTVERRAYENMVGEARLSFYGGGQYGNPAEDDPAAAELL